MRNKKGATEWTIGKLLSLILLVIFLVLVIWGYTTGGLNPLIQKTEGKFDEVLILFHLKDGGGTNLKCVTYQNMKIDGINEVGDFTQCVNECNITYKNPVGNFKISAFKIASGGGTFPGGCHFQILIGKEIYCEDKYIINIKEAKEAKAAYLALKSLVGDLGKEYGQNFDDFMRFDERYIELDAGKKYFFNGLYWSVDGSKIAEELFRANVIDYYRNWGSQSVEWGRKGDEKRYLPVSEVLITDIVPKREQVSKDDFKIWFLKKLKEGKNLEFNAGDGMSYIYTNGNWATSGGTEEWSDEEVLDSIFNFYNNGKVVLWNYQNEDKKYLSVSNVPIATDAEKNKGEDSHALGSWLVKKREEWKASFSNAENYKEVLNGVFSSGEIKVNLGTKEYKVNEIKQITGKDGSIMPLIFFVDGSYQYGIFYDSIVGDYRLAGWTSKDCGMENLDSVNYLTSSAKMSDFVFQGITVDTEYRFNKNWEISHDGGKTWNVMPSGAYWTTSDFCGGIRSIATHYSSVGAEPISVYVYFNKEKKMLDYGEIMAYIKSKNPIDYSSATSNFTVSPYDKFIRLDDKIWEDIELDALVNNFFHTKC